MGEDQPIRYRVALQGAQNASTPVVGEERQPLEFDTREQAQEALGNQPNADELTIVEFR